VTLTASRLARSLSLDVIVGNEYCNSNLMELAKIFNENGFHGKQSRKPSIFALKTEIL
jgi:hypothetical protein